MPGARSHKRRKERMGEAHGGKGTKKTQVLLDMERRTEGADVILGIHRWEAGNEE